MKKMITSKLLLAITALILISISAPIQYAFAQVNGQSPVEAAVDFYGISNAGIRTLYDFNGDSTFTLAENDYAYLIINNISGVVYERSDETYSIYRDVINDKLIYGGYGKYYTQSELQESQNVYYDLLNSRETYFADNSIQNNLDAMYAQESEAAPYRWSVQDRWGKNDRYTSETAKEYFSATVENASDEYISTANDSGGTYCILEPPYLPCPVDSGKIILDYDKKPGTILGIPFDKYYLKYDWKIPDNNVSCGIVAVTMILQYYDRMGLYNMIPDSFLAAHGDLITYGKNIPESREGGAKSDYNKKKIDYLAYHLHGQLDMRTPADPIYGANNTFNLKTGINNFYEDYELGNGESRLVIKPNPAYDNIVDCVKDGNLAIGMTHFVTNAYYKDGNGNWTQTDVDKHQMVIYGYCASDSGTLKDFICHSAWRSDKTGKLYVYKTNLIANSTTSIGG